MIHDLSDTIEKLLQVQLDSARQKRKAAEVYLRTVSDEIDLAHRVVGSDVIPETGPSLAEPKRVPALGIRVGTQAKVYPFPQLAELKAVNDSLAETPVLVTFDPEFSAAVAFKREVLGRKLHFRALEGRRDGLPLMVDDETESLWQALTGRAIDGPWTGHILKEIDSDLTTTFDWKALYPNSQLYSEPARAWDDRRTYPA